MSDEAASYLAGDGPVIIPAASIVIFRDNRTGGPPELLLIERADSMRFAGGATVFPGGKVDPDDHKLASDLKLPIDPIEVAARIAAVRETLEETGLVVGIVESVSAADANGARKLLQSTGRLADVLQQFGWTLDLGQLIPFARWLPRHHKDRAFDTRFYLTNLGTGNVEIEVDVTENKHLFWSGAATALELADQGKITIIYPTRRNLERLAQFETFSQCRSQAEAIPVEPITPAIEDRKSVV